MPFCDSVAVSVRIGMPRKRDFPFIKLEGKMPLFDLKCALNQPKMVQNTWNSHQSSISVSTFRKYEQKLMVVKILAAATHFSLKIPWISLYKGKKSLFLRNHAKSINSLQYPHRGLKFGMNHPYKCLQKVIEPDFWYFERLPLYWGKFPQKRGKRGKWRAFSPPIL